MSTITPAWTLGECIRKARLHAGLEQAELAERLGVSASIVSKWETNSREPKIHHLTQIEEACGVPPKWIITTATLVLPPPAWVTDYDPDRELVAA